MNSLHSIALGLVVLPCGLAFAAENLVPVELFDTSDPTLEVTLWAASPLLRNPTNLDFDSQGRLWVAEGVDYRRHYDRQPDGDRIMVLEDTDGDGKADKSSVFVQEPQLRAPMGVAVVGNKIIVSMAPDIIVYTDVDGDAKFTPGVDKREVLLTGFNGRKHDHTVHSITVGPDGQLYFNAGNCGAVFTDKSGKTFRIGSAYDPFYGSQTTGDLGWDSRKIAGQKSDDGHVWIGGFAARMNMDGSGVQIIGHNFRNSYEQTVNAYGDVFQNDNDDPPACRTTFLLEYGNAGFCSLDGQRSWQADRRPGQSVPTAEWRQEDPGTMPSGDVYGGGSPTGISFVEESALGSKYRGLLLSCEPGRNVVFGYLPKPEGAGFKLERFDFLTSNKEGKFAGGDFLGGDNSVNKEIRTFFRPSDVTVGPDGAVYVADWFDPRVGGHNDMDKSTSGAIYRVAPRGFKGKAPKVDFNTLDGAIAALKNYSVNVRGTAFHAVKSHGEAAVPKVAKLLKDKNPRIQARAVWLLSQLGPKGIALVEPLLKSADAQMRVVAFRALRRENHNLLATASKLAADPSPAVRREVALAMRDFGLAESRDILLTLAKSFDGVDRTYLEAWGTGATGKESALYDALKGSDPLKWSDAVAMLCWRLHPAQTVPDFKARALAANLSIAARKNATTVLGINAGRDAADAMLEAAVKGDPSIKAAAVWWLLNRKDSLWKDHGLDAALKQRRIYDPEDVELAASGMPTPTGAAPLKKEAVMALKGDAKRGLALTSRCVMCHRIGSEGNDVGPDLTAFGKMQTREVLVQAILEPSADISHGFEANEVVTKDGIKIEGLVVSRGNPVIVISAGGLTQMIPPARIQSNKPLGRSLMWTPDVLGLGAQDVADLVQYLRDR